MDRTDCEVCKRLIREKHRNMIWWKISCIIFAVLAVVFAILYFGCGSVVTETTIEMKDDRLRNDGDNGIIIIGGSDTNLNGTVTHTDYTPIICITIIASVAILITGGGLIAYNIVKKNDNQNNKY